MDAIEPFIVCNYLLFFLLPVWVVIGALDWWCHRRAGIEHFGPYEPLLHLVLISLAGFPILLGLFLEINAPILVVMILCLVAHEAVGYLDVRWATHHRGIPPFEQRLHDYLAAVPFAALSLVVVLHWQELVLLAGQPIEALTQSIRLRTPPLPVGVVAGILVLVFIGNVVPFLEEFARALRHRARAAS
ncbi:MAG TPA: hypothetical protein VJV39_04065 [Dongiaceae bacterium]|nr:hypothetical protein [Dongiaceae bacterium]